MLLSRYKDISYILDLNYIEGIKLINKAFEKRLEEQEFMLYCSIYPNMDKSNFIPFEKFKTKHKQKKKEQSKEEALKMAQKLTKVHKGIHEGVVRN